MDQSWVIWDTLKSLCASVSLSLGSLGNSDSTCLFRCCRHQMKVFTYFRSPLFSFPRSFLPRLWLLAGFPLVELSRELSSGELRGSVRGIRAASACPSPLTPALLAIALHPRSPPKSSIWTPGPIISHHVFPVLVLCVLFQNTPDLPPNGLRLWGSSQSL